MVKRIGTSGRRKTRHLFSKKFKDHGKISISRYMASYNVGDSVLLKIEPSVHEGFFHRNFYGKTGVVVGKRGSAYIVEVKDGNKKKQVITKAIHLQKIAK
ncbi:MAG: 50S ribosomal protein L21e [Nitrospiraceae bacterium]|nr:50S ribosomal protein L21e [Nitrospiraceae bacterium]